MSEHVNERQMSGGETPGEEIPVRLTVRGLEKRFAELERPALAKVDLEAEPGEILAVVGESGSGKSTLLRTIAGLEIPEGGAIRIGPSTVTGAGTWVPPERRDVGMVFQEFALFPHLTVRENVSFGLRSLSRKEKKARSQELLDRVGLGGLDGRYPHQLSGGQRQRVALARALAPGPKLLLLDEPFSNLDVPLKAELRQHLSDLLESEPVTTLLVVHEPDDVFSLADRVAVMRDGRILQVGAPDQVYSAPRDEYCACLFGEANIVACRAVDGGLMTPLGLLTGVRCRGRDPRVVVRPEHLVVCAGPNPPGTPAVVEDVRRRGGQRRLRVCVRDCEEECRLVIHADEDSCGDPRPGDRVGVRLRPGAPRVVCENCDVPHEVIVQD